MATTDNTSRAPLVSIVLPMNDHRGYSSQAIASWTRGQTAEAASFEMIVILDDTCRELEAGIRPLLRDHDTLVVEPGVHEMEQYDRGARMSRGEYIFFSESHCFAMPDTVAETIAYFREHSDDGLCAESAPVCYNRTARMEYLMFQEGWKTWIREGHWCRVVMRGFGIRRGSYLSSGGFRTRYGRFSEWLFAADLHDRGYRVGIAPRVIIQHAYSKTLAKYDWFIRNFTEGEGLFWLESPREFFRKYFGAPPEWELSDKRPAHLARMMSRLLIKELLSLRSVGSTVHGLRRGLAICLALSSRKFMGPGTLLAATLIRIRWAKIRLHLWSFSEKKMYAAFRDYWGLTTSAARLRFLINHHPADARVASGESMIIEMDSVSTDDLYGFHGLETSGGIHFRWSSPAAAVKMTLKPGDYSASISMLDIRPLERGRGPGLFWNGMPIRNFVYDAQSSSIRFSISREMIGSERSHWLVMFYPPLNIRGRQRRLERRDLGLPVVRIRCAESAEGVDLYE